MYNLVIDIGNSNTHIGIYSKKLLFSDTFPTHSENSIRNADKVFSFLNKKVISNCAISSVVPDKENFWFQYLKIKLKIEPLIINNTMKLPVKIKVKNINSVGSDRVCNAVCGFEYFKRKQNVIVIDMGTAITYDIVYKNGDFVGGIIAPGLGISAKILNFNTGRLPQLNSSLFVFPKWVIGKDTRSAIQSGLMYSAKHSIEGIVKSIKKETGRKYKIIITGGNSKSFISRFSFNPVFLNNSVLYGLNRIIEYNR